MATPLLFHLPDPVGWIALTPDTLREAQLRAREAIGVERDGDVPSASSSAAGYVSAEEAARALGVQASWLLRRARMRKVPFLKVGKYCRFDIEQVRSHFAKEAKK
jgi:hypothetical protein